ncbi:DUF6602 domain-containing protein [Streptomyces sp. NPDC005728]|uniref:DUF6602 domain-containing protein n=1 Tax=Streptomyces sp. NPDC005728 TaxID=3157054 RepID=UPI0033FA983C
MLNRNLVAMLRSHEKRLAAALEESRSSFKHAGLRGDVVEFAFRDFLDQHLPRHFTVGTGEVLDLSDQTSSQTDVVVANIDQPFRSGLHEPGVFLIEGVAAAGEIKSALTIKDLDDSLKKGALFKRLRNRHTAGELLTAGESDLARFHECPPYFLFAFESVVATETLMKKLNEAPLVSGPDGAGPLLRPLDGVFVLGRGSAVDYGDGQGALQWRAAAPDGGVGASVPGWMWRDTDTVIAEFLIWLGAVTPRQVRFSPVAVHYLIRHMQTLQAGMADGE